MRNSILYLFISVLVFSCEKEDFKNEFDHITGDYQWYYSYRDIGDSFTSDDRPNRFGIRIKSNSKIMIYANDEIIYKGVIKKSAYWENGTIVLVSESNTKDLSFEFYNNEISILSMPFEGYKSYFKKIE